MAKEGFDYRVTGASDGELFDKLLAIVEEHKHGNHREKDACVVLMTLLGAMADNDNLCNLAEQCSDFAAQQIDNNSFFRTAKESACGKGLSKALDDE